MLTALLVLDIVLFMLAVLMVAQPRRVDAIGKRALCAIHLMKRSRLGVPMPRWELVLSVAVGLLLIAYVVNDFRQIHFAIASRTIPTWHSATASMLDAATRKEINANARDLIRSGKSVGLVIGVVDGDESCVLGYGRKSLRGSATPDGDTEFEIGSITKTFTALSFAILAERGVVKMDDPLSAYLPRSVRIPEYKGRRILLKDLGNHTSGLPSVIGTLEWLGDEPYASYTTEKMYRALSRYELTRAPGAKYEYSNMGMGLLGHALSRKLGVSYEEMVRSLVLEPLDMRDTAITLSGDQRSRLADGYALQGRVGRLEFAVPGGSMVADECFVGAGAIRSTANDMLKYLKANMALGPKSDALPFRTIHVKTRDCDEAAWIGLGWHGYGSEKTNIVLWHNGQTYGYESLIAFSKKHRKGLVILSNSATDDCAVDDLGFTLIVSMLRRS